LRLSNFTKGLNTLLAPHLIPDGYGSASENVDYQSGVLAPLKGKTPAQPAPADFAYYSTALSQWRFTAAKADYAEGHNTLVYTDRVAGLRWTNGVQDKPVGLQPPTGAATALVVDIPAAPHTSTLPAQLNNYGTSASFITLTAATVAGTTIQQDAISDGYPDLQYAAVPVLTQVIGGITYNMRGDPIYRTVPATPAPASNGQYYQVGFNAGTLYEYATFVPTQFANSVELYRMYRGEWYFLASIVDPLNAAVSWHHDGIYDLSAVGTVQPTPINRASGFQGAITYYLTFYDPQTGYESPPQVIANTTLTRAPDIRTTVAPVPPATWTFQREQGVVLSGIPIPTTNVVKRLYRLGGSLTVPTLVTELFGAASDYVDVAADDAIDGRLLDLNNGLPPTDIKYVIESNAVLFGASGSKVFYSKVGDWGSWPAFYFIEYSQAVTGLAAVVGGVLVFTENKTHLITGESHTRFSTRELCADVGCLSHDTIQTAKGTAIWLGHNGLYTSAGTTPKTLTRHLLGRYNPFPVDSALVDRVYYLLEGSGATRTVDLEFNVVQDYKDGTNTRSLAVKGADVYAVQGTTLYQLFAAATPLSWTFFPRLLAVDVGQAKVFKRVRISYTGSISVGAYIDDDSIPDVNFNSAKTFAVAYLQVPAELTRGSAMQLRLSGTGTIYDVEVEVASANA